MKMRLRPLRGETYMYAGRELLFLERIAGTNKAKMVNHMDGEMGIVEINKLDLPIIDTKDYEKIEDRKYKGD